MSSEIFSKQIRIDIFRLFLTKEKLKFSEIQKALKIHSNNLTYHLKIMCETNILEKKNNFYLISNSAKKFIPLFSNMIGEKLSPLPVVLISLLNENKVLMIKRANRPYKNYWALIGGRILHNETFKEATNRLILKKSGILLENPNEITLCDVVDEKVTEEENIQNSFILFFTKITTNKKKFKETEYGKLKWIDLNEINQHKIIPSDLWLLKNNLNNKYHLKKVEMKSINNRLIDFKIE